MGGSATRNLDMFQKLVGEDNMRNVKLVTTMWSEVLHKDDGEKRLGQLVGDFWNGMITAGAQVERYDRTGEDGKRNIRSILNTSPVTLLFQQEMRNGHSPGDTSAGKSLMGAFIKLQEKYDRDLKGLQDNAAADRERYEEALRKRDEAARQIRKLQEEDIVKLEARIKELENRGPVKCSVM
jgi:hypothetical protein